MWLKPHIVFYQSNPRYGGIIISHYILFHKFSNTLKSYAAVSLECTERTKRASWELLNSNINKVTSPRAAGALTSADRASYGKVSRSLLYVALNTPGVPPLRTYTIHMIMDVRISVAAKKRCNYTFKVDTNDHTTNCKHPVQTSCSTSLVQATFAKATKFHRVSLYWKRINAPDTTAVLQCKWGELQ